MGFGVFDRATIKCPAGAWTTVISNFGSGFPKDFELVVHAADGQPVTGQYRESRAWWIFPMQPTLGALAPTLRLHRDWINAIYKVEVKPDRPCTVEVR